MRLYYLKHSRVFSQNAQNDELIIRENMSEKKTMHMVNLSEQQVY